MAEKDKNDEGKEKDDDTEDLVVVTDETPPKKPESDEDTGEDESDDSLEVSADDERLGGSEEETVDQERERSKEQRRGQRKSRNKARREWGDRMVRENRFLALRNEQLEKQALENARRLDALEGVTVEGRIQQFKAALEKADDTIADAVSRHDGETHKEATRIRDNLRSELTKLETAQVRQKTRDESREGLDPVIRERTQEWASKYSWLGKDPDDTSIVQTIDDRLAAEGRFDPRSEEYWQELDRRVAKYLPHRFKGRGRSRDTDMGDDDDRDLEARNERGGNGKGNGHDREDRDEQPRRRSGGPRFRSGGAERQLGPNEVYLSADRLEAMREAGIEEGSAEYKSLLKRYQQWDRENNRA